MAVRLSTNIFYQRNVDNVNGHMADVSKLNIHLSEGKRVIHAADDPVAASSIARLKQNNALIDRYLLNSDIALAFSTTEEVTLNAVSSLYQRTRELAISVGNGTYNAQNREAVAVELEELKKELLSLANTKDGNSEFIFAGFEVETRPFQVNEFNGEVDYHGDAGVRKFQVGPGVTIDGNDSGEALFIDIPGGNKTFVSDFVDTNTGSGVIDEGVVIDDVVFDPTEADQYFFSFNEVPVGSPTEYSVFGVKEQGIAGDAEVKLIGIDQNDVNFIANSIDPLTVGDSENITFTENPVGSGQFDVQIAGSPAAATATSVYDSTNSNPQQIIIDGVTIEVTGIPVSGDTYEMTTHVGRTQYEPNQNIEFNGIKTTIKGYPTDQDGLELVPSNSESVFTTIQNFIDALRIPGEQDVDESKREMIMNNVRLQLDNAIERLTETRAKIGARIKTMENQRSSNEDFKLNSQTTISRLEDLDMAQAISDFERSQSALQVSQQTFVQLNGLTIFDYL